MKDHGTYLVPTVYLEDWLIENYKTLGYTGTVAPRKPTSSWAPADRKALARSRLLNGRDSL
jgi:hypothetical protein